MKNAIILFIFTISSAVLHAQQGCTIQANCTQAVQLSASGKDSVLIYGVVTASDGVKTFSWIQKSGPNTAVLSTPTATQTQVKGIVSGTYIFNFSATTVNGTSLAPIPDTLIVQPFVDRIDSVKVFWHSGKQITNQ